eukprot:gnl/TRDRNA2_/TRDRNA2_183432_c0_seq1.p1 gnl/TRDRNA2_/TRDRNA2_183432_c0~~gnl/TRDRNA2_/TRDRNA2_183432_c0_seq1.p1  ORF type:complete len:172 (-),score=32.75 gnl/TRDRNA2_/TRDRNA2_183432_c0_seq1:101-616(-)
MRKSEEKTKAMKVGTKAKPRHLPMKAARAAQARRLTPSSATQHRPALGASNIGVDQVISTIERELADVSQHFQGDSVWDHWEEISARFVSWSASAPPQTLATQKCSSAPRKAEGIDCTGAKKRTACVHRDLKALAAVLGTWVYKHCGPITRSRAKMLMAQAREEAFQIARV